MDTDTSKAARKAFAQRRDDLVYRLEQLALDQPQPSEHNAIVTYLRRMSMTLDKWSTLTEDKEGSCLCFPTKCSNLSTVMIEVAAQIVAEEQILHDFLTKMPMLLAMQVGQITLDGHSEDDSQAAYFARKVAEEQVRFRWLFEPPPARRAIDLHSLWDRMSRITEPGPDCTLECLIAHANR